MAGRIFLAVVFATLATLSSTVNGLAIETVDKRQDSNHWVDTWTSMPQLVESNNMPPSQFVSLKMLLRLGCGPPD